MERPFRSDGCSSPLQYIADRLADFDFAPACIVHDWLYWQGGNRKQREWADRILRRCIELDSRYPSLARAYYRAVRLFGWLPYSDNWSWGYGWSEQYRGADTFIPKYLTPYSAENQRWKLEQALRNA